MGKKSIKKAKISPSTPTSRQQHPVLLYLLLIAYCYLAVITPDFKAYDAGGPKFLSLALLNIIAFIYLFSRKDLPGRPDLLTAFFRHPVGIVLSGLLVISLISFLKAINVIESIVQFSKAFTVFSATCFITLLIILEKRSIRVIGYAMLPALLIDCMFLISEVSEYIIGKIGLINEIKFIYSNKNIFAASIFIKAPFALWFMFFGRRWEKVISTLISFLTFTALLFLSSRAFYLGTIVLSLFVAVFLIILYRRSHQNQYVKNVVLYFTLFSIAFLIFTLTQRFLYPKSEDAGKRSVLNRLESVADSGGGERYHIWYLSWLAFKQDPLLGIGAGNWKLVTVGMENKTASTYKHHYKAHNDFIEVTTETGIFGGLLYTAFFILAGWLFIRAFRRNNPPGELIGLLLPVMGLLCYFFDAFFNFPHDRPEIQSLFAIYTAILIGLTAGGISDKAVPGRLSVPGWTVVALSGILLLATTYVLYLNVKSLRLQRIVAEEKKQNLFNHPAAKFMEEFPAIPTLSATGEPISLLKSRYLFQEKRYDEVLNLLKNERSSPYDVRIPYFIAFTYFTMHQTDSALVYAKKAATQMPNYFNMVALYSTILLNMGNVDQCISLMDSSSGKIGSNKQNLMVAFSIYRESGKYDKALAMLDTLSKYFPGDTVAARNRADISRKAFLLAYQSLYDSAATLKQANKFVQAARVYAEILEKAPDFQEARISRAYCLYHSGQSSACLLELDYLLARIQRADLYNMRGAVYHNLGQPVQACENFRISAEMGDKQGITNYSLHCKK